jgi:protease-4
MKQQSKPPVIDFTAITHTIQSAAVSLVNMQRENLAQSIDYVQFTLPVQMPELPEQRNFIQQQFIGKPVLSLIEFEQALDRIANDSRPKGVILYLRGLAMSLANLQTLRDILMRFRNRGKRVVCYAQEYGMAEYYVASVADQILLQPGGDFRPVGLFMEQTFLKEGLKAIGLEADAVQITPFKSGPDTLTRQEPSDENIAQMNWLIDSRFEMLVAGIASGRGLSPEQVEAMIHQAPYTDLQAREAGYIDAICNEEGLAAQLGVKEILLWQQADQVIPLKMPRNPQQYVAVLPAMGTIMPGESATPPVDVPVPLIGGERVGDITLVQQVRNLMQDEHCVALVLYVDSPGGSAAASEAMASALDEFARQKPIVVYMAGVAASGGYYISTPADYIIAQPGTITGSIGVFSFKLVNSEALRKLRFNPITYQRGEHAGMLASNAPFKDSEREKVRESIERIYDQFLERVAQSRKMKVETVDQVAGGRVWTGKQALDHGLVDALGGLHEAVAKARELAKAPADTPFGVLYGKGKPLPAQVAEQADPAAALRYWQQGLEQFSGSTLMCMPFEIKG